MTNLLDIFKCTVCGNIVEVVHTGIGELVCCNQPMVNIKENTTDASQEKHVPAVEEIPEGIKAKIGSLPHPMEEKHYIEWIEVISNGKTQRNFLMPGDTPETNFAIDSNTRYTVREYCNIHGLWRYLNDK